MSPFLAYFVYLSLLRIEARLLRSLPLYLMVLVSARKVPTRG